ncbi:MAG: RecX family transcriptional regulator [Candidatus Marinimicrobia bacterium]|nr:RecX family transcriptional regulator [Candidatus Neomarinimicrobiota bacterium]MDD5581932.1 RecX family transcriptional regulator [Candidatus Neomarinimicrobiota bacterium]
MMLESLRFDNRRKSWMLTFSEKESFSVSDELKQKYGLHPGMEISEDRVSTLKKEAEHHFVFEKALELLSYREHSTYELKTKLLQKGYSLSLVHDVIKQMISKGYLDDERFATYYFQELLRRGNYGPFVIKRKMLEKGVNKQIIEKKLASVSQKEWEQIARKILNKKQKKLGRNPEKIRDTLLTILIQKGFDYGSIQNVVNEYSKMDL